MNHGICYRLRVGTPLAFSWSAGQVALPLNHLDTPVSFKTVQQLWSVLGTLDDMEALIKAQFNLRHVLRLGLLRNKTSTIGHIFMHNVPDQSDQSVAYELSKDNKVNDLE